LPVFFRAEFLSVFSGTISESQHTACTHRVLPELAGGCRPHVLHKAIENRSSSTAGTVQHCWAAHLPVSAKLCAPAVFVKKEWKPPQKSLAETSLLDYPCTRFLIVRSGERHEDNGTEKQHVERARKGRF
jgi:hypothetical protein